MRRSRSSWGAQFPLLAIVLAPTLLYVGTGEFEDTAEQLVAASAGILGVLVLVSALLVNWRVGWSLTLVLAIIGVLDFAYLWMFGWPLDANALALVGETNLSDALEMVGGVPLLAFAPIAVIVALAIASWRDPTMSAQRPAAVRLGIYALLALTLVYGSVLAATRLDPVVEKSLAFPASPAGQARAWRGGFPTGLPWIFVDLAREQRALRAAAERNAQFTFGATSVAAAGPRRVHVLVIGEASRAGRWQLNGYARPTTPLLSARHDIVSYARMYSPWAFSRLAVPLVITRKPETSTNAMFEEASIVRAFSEAGFRTAWISLKPALGYHASPVSVHAQEADRAIFINATDKGSKVKSDLAALPVLRQVIEEDDRDLFVVVHTIGSHFDYSRRYPRDDAHFLPDRPPGGRLELFERRHAPYLSNAYDNSIRLTDRLLSGVISELEQRPVDAWMYYASDHGEALFDGCGGSGHGQLAYETQSVAAVFWASERYARRHVDLVAAMATHRSAPLTISTTFETLSDLGGLAVPGNRPGMSLAAADVLASPTAERAERRRSECMR